MVVAGWGTEAWGLTLEEAVGTALAYNRELARSGLGVEGKRVGEAQARERVRALRVVPVGRAEAGSGTTVREAGLEGSWTGPWGTTVGVMGGGKEWDFEAGGETRRGEVSVSVSQPLFRNWGREARDEPATLAGEAWESARRAWERQRSELAVQVAEAFEGAAVLEAQVALERAGLGRWERLAALSGARERRGESTRSDTLRLEWQKGEAGVRLETALGALAVKRQELADLMGVDRDDSWALEAVEPEALDVSDAEAVVATGLERRPEVAQAAADVASAERQVRLARRGRMPDVRVTARERVFGEGEEWSDAGAFDQDEWTVGFEAQMDLYGREAELAVRQAEVGAEAARAALESTRARVALEVWTAVAGYRTRMAEWQLAQRNRARAEERAELAGALFEAGRG
ncbi:MAG: TolC family protein, partial [Kiritimatiellae bacterium]|nr:TolC family protein [Kiritimatiellia bacterium]